MSPDFGFVELLDLVSSYDSLPLVSEIPEKSPSFYYEKAEALKKYCTPDFLNDPEAKAYPKFGDWCKYISRFRTCTIAPHPSEFLGHGALHSMSISTAITTTAPTSALPSASRILTAGNASNAAGCYDDYFCEGASNGSLLFIVYGVVFSLFCSAGLLLNLACMVGFNRSTNRCGATLYFSVIAVLDCVYLGTMLALRASVHLSDVSYAGQERAYAERAAYFVPGAMPLLAFCEVASVWLVVCLLVERYLYLQRGYFSKSVTSLQRHVRIISVVTLLAFCYIIPRFFELKSEKNPNIPGGYRVTYTEFGTLKVYRSLVDYLLNVPLEMFLPYLAVGLLTSLAVSKMVDLGSSKWKTVASLCSQSAYCCCGDDFANCYPMVRPERKHSVNQVDVLPMDCVDAVPSPPRLSAFEETCGTQIYYCGIPFEKRSDLMPFYFLVPPPRQTLKETANVVITVCLGFLLLITKIPKLILVALELERYVDMDPTFTRMASECLNIAFIVLKPPIYLMLGVHFRHALTGLCCCACLYAPVISGGTHEGQNEESGDGGDDGGCDGGVDDLSKASPGGQGENLTTVTEKGGSVGK